MIDQSRVLGSLLKKEALVGRALSSLGRGALTFARKKPLTTITGVTGAAATGSAASKGTSAKDVDGINPIKPQPSFKGGQR